MLDGMIYRRRHIDSYLDDLFPDLPAIAVEGAKGVGKTETASRRVAQVYELDDGATSRLVAAGGPALLEQDPTILLDEWQHLPEAWGWGQRMVDRHSPTEVLLTGSATPWRGATTHSGAGRIVSVLMRPMSLTERGSAPGGVSLTDLLTGAPDVTARCELTLQDYAQEVCASGLPGIRDQFSRARDIQLDSYIRRIIDRDVVEQGGHPPQAREPALVAALVRRRLDHRDIHVHPRRSDRRRLGQACPEHHRDLPGPPHPDLGARPDPRLGTDHRARYPAQGRAQAPARGPCSRGPAAGGHSQHTDGREQRLC